MYENVKPFPLERYKFAINGNTVIAISTYAGKTVKGTAQCHPNDKFDLEKGKELAAARCDLKVRRKRFAAANKKAEMAWDNFKKAENFYDEADLFRDDAAEGVKWAENNLKTLEASFHKPEQVEVKVHEMGSPDKTCTIHMDADGLRQPTFKDRIKRCWNWLVNN